MFLKSTLTVIACTTICGSEAVNFLVIERRQSLAFDGSSPTLSQISKINCQSSLVFLGLVALSTKNNKICYES